MSITKELQERSKNKCELCADTKDLSVHQVSHAPAIGDDSKVVVCATCLNQIENPDTMDANHWRCLNDSMWSEVPGVQVLAWRMLTRLRNEGWPQDLLDMLYFEDDRLQWAEAAGDGKEASELIIHKDCNGNILENGDSVVLIQDLKVKGGGFTAKRGAAVHRISLVHDNAEHIEGRVDGQHIVILTQYVKKTK